MTDQLHTIESPFGPPRDRKEEMSDEEWELLHYHQRQYEPDLPRRNELHKVYPEARPIVNRLLKEKKQELRTLKAKEEEIKKKIYRNNKDPKMLEWERTIVLGLTTGPKIQECNDHIERLGKISRSYTRTRDKEGVKAEDVKHVPISNFIDFNRAGFANCLWHNEKTPSMKYYEKTNTVHCFGCDKTGDVIDVVQEVEGVDFLGAISKLSMLK